jgi:hypothetical protein
MASRGRKKHVSSVEIGPIHIIGPLIDDASQHRRGVRSERVAKSKKAPPGMGQNGIPILKVRKGATLREIYAKMRKEFTAADLQKYTVIEEGIPAQEVIRDLERIQSEEEQKLKKKRKTQ